MASSKLLSDVEIKKILEDKADEIKEKVKKISQEAADDFYGVGSSASYERTNGFLELGENPKETLSGNTLTLTFTYKASDLSVNEWDSPWGIHYPGEPDWAFDTGFVHGLHGGPRPAGRGKWTWNGVQKSTPIWDIITQKIYSL